MPPDKYGRIERERRFLLAQFPSNVTVVRHRRITDHYIEGTTLRLRHQSYNDGLTSFKLTQKLPGRGSAARQGLITSMYLTADEFCVLAVLPAWKLTKTRFSLPPFGIDVFDGELDGLILAEASLIAQRLRRPRPFHRLRRQKFPRTIVSPVVDWFGPHGKTSRTGSWTTEWHRVFVTFGGQGDGPRAGKLPAR